MYSLEIICKECGHIIYFQENELCRIASISNDLEIKVKHTGLCCNICEQIGPMQFVGKDIYLDLVFFEKIISPIPHGHYGVFPTEIRTNTTSDTSGKPTMDNPCILCTATGRIEVQYKAHKKEGSFKGVLTEECPMCNGKGYFK